jgi:hypothetical protein
VSGARGTYGIIEGKGPFGRNKRRRNDNIKTGIQVLGRGVADLNYLGSG